MFLQEIQHFQAVVENNSFTLAAEQCHISQPAISQHIQALEARLGVKLLERKNRSFTLTEAGKHFYKRSLVIIEELEQLCRETVRISKKDTLALSVGYLSTYDGEELSRAVASFSKQYPSVHMEISTGNHEELYDDLRFGKLDLVLNDQRRKFSSAYENWILRECLCYVEVATHNPLSQLPCLEISELNQVPCILVASDQQQEEEQRYYHEIVGFQGAFLFAKNIQDARVMVVSNQGVFPVESEQPSSFFGATLRRVPLTRNGDPIRRTYCAFWKKDNSNPYTEIFGQLLRDEFA